MKLARHTNESLEAFLKRIEGVRDTADLQAIEAAKILHQNETEHFRRGDAYGFDKVLADLQQFRNTSRAMTQQAIEVADEIKTAAFLEKWEKANK